MRSVLGPLAAALAVPLLLTGCTGSAGPHRANPPDLSVDEPVAGSTSSGTADGVVDQVVDTAELPEAAEGNNFIREMAVDGTGAPVALIELGPDGAGGATLFRLGDGAGWTQAALPLDGAPDTLALAPAPDGSVVAVVRDIVVTDDGAAVHSTVEISRVTSDGLVSTADVPEQDLSPGMRFLVAAVSPDGGTAYFAGVDGEAGRGALVAVDTGTGAITGQTGLDPVRTPSQLAVTDDGDVLLATRVPLEDGHRTAVLDRFRADLQPAGEVPLSADSLPAEVVGLAARGSTAYVTLADGDAVGDEATFLLQSVAPGAAAPDVVGSWAAGGWFEVVPSVHPLAIDPTGTTAWVLGGPDSGSQDAVTPVSLADGTAGEPIRTDSDAQAFTLAVSGDGRQVFVGGHYEGARRPGGSAPVVFTVG